MHPCTRNPPSTSRASAVSWRRGRLVERILAQPGVDDARRCECALIVSGAAVFADGALPNVTKQLIAVAVAHVTQCPYCIKGHTAEALKQGASEQQIMEAIWVAAEMRAGGAYAHSALALDTMAHAHDSHPA